MLIPLLFTFAAAANVAPGCLIVVMGGGFQSSEPISDIAQSVYNQTVAQARRTNCRVVTSDNQNSTAFLSFVRSLGRGLNPDTAVHLTFVGHGSPRGQTALEGYVVSGLGRDNWTRNADFIDALKTAFPQGTRLTYSTNNCYPRWHELMQTTGMTERYEMCGVSSADPSTTSMNFWNIFRTNDRMRGSYTPLGFMRVNEDLAQRRTPTTLSMFHYHARLGDSNTLHSPGTTSSVHYANQVLVRSRETTPVPLSERFLAPLVRLQQEAPGAEWVRYATLDRAAVVREVENLIRVSVIAGRGMTFRPVDNRGIFGTMMVGFSRQLQELSAVDPRTLPMPASQGSQTARNYFHNNAPQIANWVADAVIDAATFARDGGTAEAWKTRPRLALFSLFTPLFHMRTLQEALVVQKFRAIATDAESQSYYRLLGCENMPMLSSGLPTDFSPEWDHPGVRQQ